MKSQGFRVSTSTGLATASLLAAMLVPAQSVASPMTRMMYGYETVHDTDKDGVVIWESELVYEDFDGVRLSQENLPLGATHAGATTAGSSGANGYIGNMVSSASFWIEHDGTDPASWLIDFELTYSMSVQASGEAFVSATLNGDSLGQEFCVASSGTLCPLSVEGIQHFSMVLHTGETLDMGWVLALDGHAGLDGGEGSFSAAASFWLDIVGASPFAPSQVPEPSSLLLFSLGLAGLGLHRRRRSQLKLMN